MNIVHVGAHQDDEMFALGTFLKYRAKGEHTISFICVTNGDKGMSWDPSVPLEKAAKIRDKEMRAVADQFNAAYICLGESDEFLYDTKETRLKLIDYLRAFRAELIFTHWKEDYNLDHITTSNLVFQASMLSVIASIQTEHEPLNMTPKIFYCDVGEGYGFPGTHFVEIDENTMQDKLRIIRLHKSQIDVSGKMGPDYADRMMDRNTALGRRARIQYAEVFAPCLADRRIPLANMLP